jgi:hypothetical protein
MDAERIARLIRMHGYDSQDETCACVSVIAASRRDIEHMSILEHSRHVADVILRAEAEPPPPLPLPPPGWRPKGWSD